MKFLLERTAAPLTDWDAADLKEAIHQQVQRLVEGHRLVRGKAAVDLISLALDSESVPGSPVGLSAHATAEHAAYAKQIERLIQRFEPRLLNPRVIVLPATSEAGVPRLEIQARMAHVDKTEEFRFPVQTDGDFKLEPAW